MTSGFAYQPSTQAMHAQTHMYGFYLGGLSSRMQPLTEVDAGLCTCAWADEIMGHLHVWLLHAEFRNKGSLMMDAVINLWYPCAIIQSLPAADCFCAKAARVVQACSNDQQRHQTLQHSRSSPSETFNSLNTPQCPPAVQTWAAEQQQQHGRYIICIKAV